MKSATLTFDNTTYRLEPTNYGCDVFKADKYWFTVEGAKNTYMWWVSEGVRGIATRTAKVRSAGETV